MKQIPFAICPAEMFFDSRLNKNHLRVLGAIMTFRNRNTDLANPTREQIAYRLGKMPLTKVSTVTSDLVRLGWLEKVGKGGFSKACKYRVLTPQILTDQMEQIGNDSGADNVESTVTKTGTVDDETTVTKTVTVPKTGTVTEPVTTTVPKTVTKPFPKQERARNRPEQTNNRVKESKPKKNLFKKIDLSGLPDEISEAVAKEWISHRIAKKCPIDEQATFERQMKTAISVSQDLSTTLQLSPEKVITESIDAGWQGIGQPAWLKNRLGEKHASHSKAPRNQSETPFERTERLAREAQERSGMVVDPV